MKIIHFADTHIGIDTHGSIDSDTKLNIRVLDVLDGLDAMIDMAVEEDVDLVIFAGDAFHKHSPAQSYVNEFGKRILKLRSQCPVVLLVGNHDMPGSDRASALEIYKTLEVEGVIVGKSCELYEIETKSGILQVATVPYPSRAWLNPKEIYGLHADAVAKLLKEETASRIRKLAKRVNPDLPAVLVGHFTAEGCQYGSERSTFISNADAAVSLDELTLDAWDYVALGHIHKHQNLTEGMTGLQPVVYAGSIDRVDFGEEKDKKGFVLIDIKDKHTSWEFIDVNARPFHTLQYRVKGKDATEKLIDKIDQHKDLEGAVVRVIITPVTELTRDSIDKEAIKELLIKRGVFSINSFSILRPEELSEEQISTRGTTLDASMNPREMLITYFEGLGKDDKEVKSLMKEFSSIVSTCEVEND